MKSIQMASLAMALLLCGCGSVTVKTASEDNFHPAKYKTFGFRPPDRDFNPKEFTPENQARVRAAIGDELEKKGLRPSESPDLWIAFYLRVKTKEFNLDNPTAQGDSMADTMKSHYGFVFGSGKSLNQQETIPYREGTLVVTAADAKSKRVVWQALAQGALHRNSTEDAVENRIREAVRKMFAHFR
jgi:hypothetical protein